MPVTATPSSLASTVPVVHDGAMHVHGDAAVHNGNGDSAMAESNATDNRVDAGNELMLALQRGDSGAVSRLFGLYNAKLYSFVMRIVGDSLTAEDIIQETWMTLYERRSVYQPTFRFSTWLFTIARRKALSELRRRSVRSVVRSLTFRSSSGEHEEMEITQTTFVLPDAKADGALLGKMVERALSKLSARQREIVLLRDVEGFEPEEIAQILEWNVKPGALRKRIFDAREAFRREMVALGYHEKP